MTIPDLHFKYQNLFLDYPEAEQLLYSFDRDKRFELFIALFNTTLKDNPSIAYQVFKEAYCASDNIYQQIKNSQFLFNLKDFLHFLKSSNVDIIGLMKADEKKYYNELPKSFKIYRGLSKEEYLSKYYGISWTLDEEIAKKYIHFTKNNVKEGELANEYIEKKEIFSIFSVHGEKEIIYIKESR